MADSQHCGRRRRLRQLPLAASSDSAPWSQAQHAEHGLLEIGNPAAGVKVGQKIELWVQYSDATVNLHRQMYGVRNGEVEEVFAIEH